MSSAAVYFLFSEMPNLSFKNGIIFSGSQQTEVGTILYKKKKNKSREGKRPIWINDIIVHAASSDEISVYSEGRILWENANEMEFTFWDIKKKIVKKNTIKGNSYTLGRWIP